jgi:diaminohydroxyphosphoribosylaminopyrimidine deaminase/5-amino-6-(5-phosphoribosylamino)uracil reductase
MHAPQDPIAQALTLASQAVGLSEPNPRVGCVIVGADGTVLGLGHTQERGGPHAEVMALRDAMSRWSLARTTAAPAPAAMR